MPEEKKCVVYYKTGWLSARLCKGDRFDRLDACCDQFSKVFLTTGNEKNTDWNRNSLFDEKQGLNFCNQGGEFRILFNRDQIKFCPWSGHEIEVKKSGDVTIKQKTKEVPDGYEEVEPKEGWDK